LGVSHRTVPNLIKRGIVVRVGRGFDLNLCRRSVDLFEFLAPLRSAAMKPAYGFATPLVRGGRSGFGQFHRVPSKHAR
jgi:hypothetical protein